MVGQSLPFSQNTAMIRLILVAIFFLLSLLAVFKAPAYYLWLMAIAVTEYALIFSGITFLLLIWGIWYTPYRAAGNIIAFVALLLYLSPLVRAGFAGSSLRTEMDIALGSTRLQGKDYNLNNPFSITGLLTSQVVLPSESYTYVNYGDLSLALDFYRSRAGGRRPCVIVVHGGSWSSGDNKQLPELNAILAEKGYHVAAINYRLAPQYQTPSPVEDIANCIRYLKDHSEELSLDTSRIVLLGRSAGAQIALLAAYTLHDPSVIGVIDFYGPADMVWGYSLPSNPLIMDSRKVMEDYIGGAYPEIPAKYEDCSPIRFVNKLSPPTLIIHGRNDVLVAYEHSRRLDLKLQENGVKHYWLKLPWATHGFDYHINGPGGQLSTFAVETFLKNITN